MLRTSSSRGGMGSGNMEGSSFFLESLNFPGLLVLPAFDFFPMVKQSLVNYELVLSLSLL